MGARKNSTQMRCVTVLFFRVLSSLNYILWHCYFRMLNKYWFQWRERKSKQWKNKAMCVEIKKTVNKCTDCICLENRSYRDKKAITQLSSLRLVNDGGSPLPCFAFYIGLKLLLDCFTFLKIFFEVKSLKIPGITELSKISWDCWGLWMSSGPTPTHAECPGLCPGGFSKSPRSRLHNLPGQPVARALSVVQ